MCSAKVKLAAVDVGSLQQVSPHDILRPKSEPAGHFFVRMSTTTNTSAICDVCGKSLATKAAITCQSECALIFTDLLNR